MVNIALNTDPRPAGHSLGFTDTLEDAKREFATACRRRLAKTGKDEEAHRTGMCPRRGRRAGLLCEIFRRPLSYKALFGEDGILR